MKILLVAPQPFYIDRGTPIAVDLLLRALSDDGHCVDLLTFPMGEPRTYPGVRHFRVGGWLGFEQIKPGFSPAKLVLDFFLFFKLIGLLLRRRYQVVHAVEESVFMAMLLAPVFRFKYVYDMDSSMAGQIQDKLPAKFGWLGPVLEFMESLPMRFATVVVPVCEALADQVKRYRQSGLFLLKDISLVDKTAEYDNVLNVRQLVPEGAQVLMYIGNLETYQGIDLMIEGFARLAPEAPDACLVVVGGAEHYIEKYRQIVSGKGLQGQVYFVGPQPVSHLYPLMTQADILLSPRTQGVNTPMKVYSYMDSGVPVLATRLPTHTQVMTDERACLVEPQPQAMAAGMKLLLADPAQRASLAQTAQTYIQAEHSLASFKNRVRDIYQYLATR